MRQGGTSRHIPMLLATTFLVAGWNAGTAAQDQPSPEAAARDANAQAISLDTISVEGGSGRAEGYFTPSTSVATKTNTPLINIPQSLTVVTRDFIKDKGSPSLTDITRYVPGVAVHQGEVPVFWACGVTPQAVALESRPEFMITHEPGIMFLTDLPREGDNGR